MCSDGPSEARSATLMTGDASDVAVIRKLVDFSFNSV